MKVTALQIRQKLGSILKKLESTGQPIIVEKDRKPVAVLISLEDFRTRFLEYQDRKEREDLYQDFLKHAAPASPDQPDSVQILRELRYGKRS